MVDWLKLILKVLKKTWKYGAAGATGYEAHELLSPSVPPPAPLPIPPTIIRIPNSESSLLWVIIGVIIFMAILYIGAKCVAFITMVRYSDSDDKNATNNRPANNIP